MTSVRDHGVSIRCLSELEKDQGIIVCHMHKWQLAAMCH